MKIIGALAAFLIAVCVALAINQSSRWRRDTRDMVAGLAPRSTAPAVFDSAAMGSLPPPVARYLTSAISDGHPVVRAAIATQDAEFFINNAWRPLRATQHFVTSPPSFVWDARIDMAPLMPAMVRDAYVNHRGMMQASLYGLYSLANEVDKPQLNAGALQRFLGEMVWMPTALLPSDTVSWAPRDDRSAVVTLKDGDTSATLLFEFGDNGLPAVISGDRFKESNGTYALQRWQIYCGETTVRDGLTIPLRCEVAWMNNGTREPYWRGRITSIVYRYDLME